MKITVSGWPGAGSSALSLLLAYTYNLKHYRGGGVFRYIYKNLDFKVAGIDRVESHNLVEPTFGPLFDKYIDHILMSNDYQNILVESDIASFRVGKQDDIVSIFLKAEQKTRIERTKVDGRGEDGEVMEAVDTSHRDAYIELHDVDIFDDAEIEQKHTIVMQNDNLSLAEELRQVEQYLETNSIDHSLQQHDFETLSKQYWLHGKQHFEQLLDKQGLLPLPQDILTDIKTLFSKEYEELPQSLKALF